jgi:2-oxoglutarate ferredoxin oxidoreductase subunit beta
MNKAEALQLIRHANTQGEFVTGLLYIDPMKPDFTELLGMHDQPLATLPAEKVRPSREALETIMESLR